MLNFTYRSILTFLKIFVNSDLGFIKKSTIFPLAA